VQSLHSCPYYATRMLGGFWTSAVDHRARNPLVFELNRPSVTARQAGLDEDTQLEGAGARFFQPVEKHVHPVRSSGARANENIEGLCRA
jgi:hypothetical protein